MTKRLPILFVTLSLFVYLVYAVATTDASLPTQLFETCTPGNYPGAFDCDVETTPNRPTHQASLMIHFSAWWSSGCTPLFDRVTDDGEEITLYWTHELPDTLACTAAITEFDVMLPIEARPEGTYPLHVMVNETLLYSTTLTVYPDRYDVYMPLFHLEME